MYVEEADIEVTVNITMNSGYGAIKCDYINAAKTRTNVTPTLGTTVTELVDGEYTYTITAPDAGLHKLEVYSGATLLGERYFNVVAEDDIASMTVSI